MTPSVFKSAAKVLGVLLLAGLLSACTSSSIPGSIDDPLVQQPFLQVKTGIGLKLTELPPPQRKVDIAVYGYTDKTGQQKPGDNFAQFSKAVTQGGDAVLIDVLKETGRGQWFSVVERVGLNNLLNERQIIDKTRQAYLNARSSNLPPLRFAGIILEGGIIDYDSNTLTGGAGARYLGIGPSVQHRRDVVTVALRAISVSTGEVLTSVSTSKTVYSTLLQGSVFSFVAVDELLELDAGFSRNEPVSLAVRQAIELAVFSLIIKGAKEGLWTFSDPQLQQELIMRYDEQYSL